MKFITDSFHSQQAEFEVDIVTKLSLLRYRYYVIVTMLSLRL